jgi:hypothetical protein
MSRIRIAIAAASLALMSAGASAQVSFESRGYGGPLGIGPNFELGGQHSAPVYGGQKVPTAPSAIARRSASIACNVSATTTTTT